MHLLNELPPRGGIQYFRLAKRQAIKSSYRIKIGAVLVDKRPVSTGYNKIKTHPKYAVPGKDIKLSIHAELDCILDARGRDIRGSSIYIYREDKQGNPRICRPCDDCMKKLREYGVHKCFYCIDKFPYFMCEIIS